MLALTVTDGTTQANTRQASTRVRRSTVHAEDHTLPAEPRTDLEVNGPLWDSHVVPTEPETEVAILTRQRVLYQGGRRVFRGRSAEDQTFILALQNQLADQVDRAARLAEELARFHSGARDVHRMQNAHRVNRVKYIANLQKSLETLQMRIRELEAQVDEQEHAMNGLRNNNLTAQRLENEIDALTQGNEGLRVRLVDETNRYERMLRDRNASAKNLAEAEKGAKRQVEELTARDATITQLRDQITKITADSIKQRTKIEDLRGDSSKKSAKVDRASE